MLLIEIIVLIGLIILLVSMLRDKEKHPEDYEIPKRRKKRRPRHKPPLTAWTWWMYADRDTGYSFKSIRRRYESERKRYH